MIIPVYKPLGSSSHQLAQKISHKQGQKGTHTGTLDPLAEGVLVVLTGEDRFKKATFSNWKKEYVFEVLVGFETDSHDLLGLITQHQVSPMKQADLKKELNLFLGRQTQVAPKFSAQRVSGQSGFDLAKKNTPFQQQENSIEIFEIELLEKKQLTAKKLLLEIKNKIKKVTGDFRQTEVMEKWQEILSQETKKEFLLWKIRVVTSKRFYVRGFVRDLGKKLHIPLTTFSIVRTKNGEFSISDTQ